MARSPIRSARPPAAGAFSGSPPSKSASLWRTRAITAPRSRPVRHAAGPAARQQRLRGTAAPDRVEHVRAIGGPRQPDAQCGCQRGEDVDGLDIGIHGLAVPLARAFEEQWHGRDVDERGLGRLEELEAGPQARAVVRGDDDQRIVVHPRVAQLRHQRADDRIDVLQLQQMPLI